MRFPRLIAFLVVLLAAVTMTAQAKPNVTGVWTFTHANGRYQGTIVLKQTGASITGSWHTAKGKGEPDTPLSGLIDGDKVHLLRTIGSLKQNYDLVLNTAGDRLDGFGEGYGIHHTNLNLQR